jgi:polyisoprenoid-binding protein YceI
MACHSNRSGARFAKLSNVNAVTLCPTKIHKFMKPLTLVVALISAFVLSANAADTFKVDQYHSSVLFSVQHLGVSNLYGRFNDISGTVVFDKDNPSKSSVELSVPVESLDTHFPKRDQSLKSPDYFDAKQFPTLTFKSTKVEGSGDTFKVSGDFTVHGVTKPLTVDFKKVGEGKGLQGEARAGGETRFTIKRSDFGMNFMQGAVGDEITIILSLEGEKQ